MGVIWLQTASGKMIHIPILESDYNTPDDPVKITTALIKTQSNRCLSGQRVVSIPGGGTVTINFDVVGRTGSCNQCGSCCTHPVASCPGGCGYILDTTYDVHKCQYLDIDPGPNRLGSPGRTACSIYSDLVDTFKGCLNGPQKPEEIWAWMANCGFTFG